MHTLYAHTYCYLLYRYRIDLRGRKPNTFNKTSVCPSICPIVYVVCFRCSGNDGDVAFWRDLRHGLCSLLRSTANNHRRHGSTAHIWVHHISVVQVSRNVCLCIHVFYYIMTSYTGYTRQRKKKLIKNSIINIRRQHTHLHQHVSIKMQLIKIIIRLPTTHACIAQCVL